jgi:hypothetical protein
MATLKVSRVASDLIEVVPDGPSAKFKPIDVLRAQFLTIGGKTYAMNPPEGCRYFTLTGMTEDGTPIVTWSGVDKAAVVVATLTRKES